MLMVLNPAIKKYKKQFKTIFSLGFSIHPEKNLSAIDLLVPLVMKKSPVELSAQAWIELGGLVAQYVEDKNRDVLNNKHYQEQIKKISKYGFKGKKVTLLGCVLKALELDPDNYDAVYQYACLLKGGPQKNRFKAIPYFEKALQLYKKCHYSALFLGDLYTDLAKTTPSHDKKIEYYQKSLESYLLCKKISPDIAGNYLLDTKIKNLKIKIKN